MRPLDFRRLVSIELTVFVIALLTLPVVASGQSNGQSPNYQVLSSNTSSDINSRTLLAVTVSHTFGWSSTSGNFSFQNNNLVNGGTTNCLYSCNYLWWVQGFVDVVPKYSGTTGAWITDSGLEVWHGGSAPYKCWVYPSSPPNINQSGWLTEEQFILKSSSQASNTLTIYNPSGTKYYTYTSTCTYPGFYTVTFINQVEGVIVGYDNVEYATFRPASTQIFSGYIDMVSNFNSMSSSSKGTQTGEMSNLAWTLSSTTGGSYGSQYIQVNYFTDST